MDVGVEKTNSGEPCGSSSYASEFFYLEAVRRPNVFHEGPLFPGSELNQEKLFWREI